MNKLATCAIAILVILFANTLALIGLGSAYGVTFATVISGVVITALLAVFDYKVITYLFPKYMAGEQDDLDD